MWVGLKNQCAGEQGTRDSQCKCSVILIVYVDIMEEQGSPRRRPTITFILQDKSTQHRGAVMRHHFIRMRIVQYFPLMHFTDYLVSCLETQGY